MYRVVIGGSSLNGEIPLSSAGENDPIKPAFKVTVSASKNITFIALLTTFFINMIPSFVKIVVFIIILILEGYLF
jgi:hypothetical protein